MYIDNCIIIIAMNTDVLLADVLMLRYRKTFVYSCVLVIQSDSSGGCVQMLFLLSYSPVSESKLTVARNRFPAFSASRVRVTSGLFLFACALVRACSMLIQKLISCSAVPEETSRRNKVTWRGRREGKRERGRERGMYLCKKRESVQTGQDQTILVCEVWFCPAEHTPI